MGSVSTAPSFPLGTSVIREFGPGSTTCAVPGEALLLTMSRFCSSGGLFNWIGAAALGGFVKTQSKIVVGPR